MKTPGRFVRGVIPGLLLIGSKISWLIHILKNTIQYRKIKIGFQLGFFFRKKIIIWFFCVSRKFEDGYVARISVYSIISAAILFSYFCSLSLRKAQKFCPLLYAIRIFFKLENIHKYEVYTYFYHFRKFHDE